MRWSTYLSPRQMPVGSLSVSLALGHVRNAKALPIAFAVSAGRSADQATLHLVHPKGCHKAAAASTLGGGARPETQGASSQLQLQARHVQPSTSCSTHAESAPWRGMFQGSSSQAQGERIPPRLQCERSSSSRVAFACRSLSTKGWHAVKELKMSFHDMKT